MEQLTNLIPEGKLFHLVAQIGFANEGGAVGSFITPKICHDGLIVKDSGTSL